MRIRKLAGQTASIFDALNDGATLLEAKGHGMGFNESPSEEAIFYIYFPISLGNPFQSLYYSDFLNNGIVTIGTNDLSKVTQLRWIGKTVLHLHWLGGIVGDAENKIVAKERIDDFISGIKQMKRNGIKIVWTIHNILPHDSILQDLQTELRVELIELCDIIHIMNEETTEIAEDYYSLPSEKIVWSPHPTYAGYYPNYTTKRESRFQLGIPEDCFVFLFFGSIQAYKGLEDLVRAFNKLNRDVEVNLRLLIAGTISNISHFKTIIDEISKSRNINLIQTRIPIEDVQYYFTAADFCVCPYRISLNSGVAHLSHTFGVPVIGPNIGGFKELLEKGGGLLYKQLNRSSLYSAMKKSLNTDSKVLSQEIHELNDFYHPKKISAEFSAKIVEALGWRTD